MPYVPFSFSLTGGLERSVTPSKANQASFYTLSNLRQSNTERGSIEQTPRFSLLGTSTQGTYWNGATSVTEQTTSAACWYGTVPGISNALTITEAIARDAILGTQLKGIVQSAVPTYTGVLGPTKGCLLRFNNVATASVALGSTYDVVIDGITTFKWRVNGGGYTAGVVIDLVNGNAIDGGSVQLYWLASTGFTINDTWSWLRTDHTAAVGFSTQRIPTVVIIDGHLFYRANDGQIFVIELSTTVGPPYIRSVGYRPVYGYSLGIFDRHLFIFGSNSLGLSGAGTYILCSDLGNYDSFIATDVNEADVFPISPSSFNPESPFYVLSGFVTQDRLFVVTTTGMYYSDYSGLPIPFAFKAIRPARFDITTQTTSVLTTRTAYIIRSDAVFTFDGVNLTLLVNLTSLGLSLPIAVFWNSTTDEIIVVFKYSLLIYQERYGTFYTRATDMSTDGVTMLTISSGLMYTGTSSRRFYQEAATFTSAPVFDSGDGTTFAVPTLITQLLGGVSDPVKEAQTIFLAPDPTLTASAQFSTGSFIKLVLSWYISNTGHITGSPVTNSIAFWSTTSRDGQISAPRTNYRYIAYQLEWTGTDGTKPCGQCTLQAMETSIYQPPQTVKQ